jgi:hypothetical protein
MEVASEAEAGPAGEHPDQGIAGWKLIETMREERGSPRSSFESVFASHRIDRFPHA